MREAFDVVVVGGGPGGSVCATRLAQRGAKVLVLEKERFPRFHLGESLLPGSMHVFEAIGVMPTMLSTFIHKHGARFHDDVRNRRDRFGFDGAWHPAYPHAFQVPRDAFDTLLFRHAESLGADVREGYTVTGAVREGERVVGVLATDPSGSPARFDAKYVVDASGRDALFAHEARSTSRIDGLDQTALFAHYEGVRRAEGDLAGDIDIVIFRDRPDARPNWFWVIPFKDGRTSVGAVVSRAWIRAHKEATRDGGEQTTTALLDAAIASSRSAQGLLEGATRVWPEALAAADFSYRVRGLVGPGWIAVGDAGGFIDPLFSTGVHLAMCGGKAAGDALIELLADGGLAREGAALGAWESWVRAGAETFVVAVRAFYAGPLMEAIFAENKHTALRRSITSLLAGDVFTDAVWLRDTRARLAEMLTAPPLT